MDDQLLDSEQFRGQGNNMRRRDLLPTWIKIFLWIFLVMGAFVPVSLVMGVVGVKWELSLYGLETYGPFSIIGILILALISLKGITAIGLWTGKEWAVKFALVDAVVGIILCVLMTFGPLIFFQERGFIIRFELALLIPYLIKMTKIKTAWANAQPS